MKRRLITAFLVLATVAHADPEQDLAFASRLGARGFEEMALAVLEKLEKSSDPDEARAGRYGKAQLRHQKASFARQRFLRDLVAGIPPRVKRDEVLQAFEEAAPKIEEFVTSRPDDLEARFLLAELLQEHAEFLTGVDYPESMVEERKALLDQHAGKAEEEFKKAISHYGKVYEVLKPKLGDDPDFASREYILATNAAYKKANAQMRWALLYPSGPKFQNYSEKAVEELDDFSGEHYDDIYGAYAYLDLGQINLARGLRLKNNRTDAETAVTYFSTLVDQLKDDPAEPQTGEVMAKAFYWHGRACNAIARGEGRLAKKNPVYLETAIKGGQKQRSKLKASANNAWALRALLEVADAYAAQGRFDEAVSLAGEVLAGARVAGHGSVTKGATQKLTGWVASVAGAGTLGPDLLFQIGESLAAQDATSNAITFYEKAISAATDDENKVKWAYPARLRIASAYRKDRRYLAAAKVGMALVDEFLASGEEEESAFGQVASEACNVARISMKVVADATKRAQDQSEYERVVGTFRDKFPSHPENADKEFATAKEAYTDKKFEKAAGLLKGIAAGTPNYWLAQRMVPQCYRNLANAAEAKAEKDKWHGEALAFAKELAGRAAGQDDAGAKKAEQLAHLFVAMSHASLGQWKEAADSITKYQAKYPNQYLKRGLELKIEVDAYLALGDLDKAEAALAKLKKSPFANSSLYRRSAYDVYSAMRKKYKGMSEDARKPMATRAALIYEDWFKTVKEPDHGLFYFLGDTLADAHRYQEAAEAMENAAALVPAGSKQQQSYNLLSAKYSMLYALEAEGMDRRQRNKILGETRERFTNVIIPPDAKDPKKQEKVLKALAARKWPKREIFALIKRNPRALLDSADLFSKSSPEGLDGRQIALRLIAHLRTFVLPTAPEGDAKRQALIPLFWEAAEKQLLITIQIAESGRDTQSKAVAKRGAAFARKLLFEHPTTGGNPERATRFKAYQSKLERLGR